MIYVAPNSKGRGVYALHDLAIGIVIERCPVILINPGVQDLYDYVFQWDEKLVAIALGYGSLYNHSFNPNAMYKRVPEENIISFTTIEPIKRDEEILVNYNGDPKDQTSVWFNVIETS